MSTCGAFPAVDRQVMLKDMGVPLPWTSLTEPLGGDHESTSDPRFKVHKRNIL